MMGVLCMTTVIPANCRNPDGGWATGGAHDLTVNPSYVRCAPPSAMRAGDARGGAGCRLFRARTIPHASPCIPCEIRFALSRPLRFAKGRISPPPPFVPTIF